MPATPAAMLAPWPRTVDPPLPLSVAELPSTTEPAPEAEAPKPPAVALAPLAVGAAAPAVLLETSSPAVPAVRLVMAWSAAKSCEPLTASVLLALTRPAATLVRVRSAPGAPILTVLVGLAPA